MEDIQMGTYSLGRPTMLPLAGWFHWPLPPSPGASRYAFTVINTYTGLLWATPKSLSSLNLFSFPLDRRTLLTLTHFTSPEIKQRALQHNILWNFYLGYSPRQLASLSITGLLKETLLKLVSGKWSPKWTELSLQALILFNSCLLGLLTLYTNCYAHIQISLLVTSGNPQAFTLQENSPFM